MDVFLVSAVSLLTIAGVLEGSLAGLFIDANFFCFFSFSETQVHSVRAFVALGNGAARVWRRCVVALLLPLL
jgi:hypothetical protein